MGRKLWSSCICIALALATGGNTVHADVPKVKTSADFKDLKDTDARTKAAADKYLKRGAIQGVTEDRFGLHETMSRAELAKTMAIVLGLKVNTALSSSRFKDVQADDPIHGYALPYVEALRTAYVSDGIDKERFDPGGLATREQMIVLMIRGIGKEADARETPGVADPTVSDYAKGYVALALHLSPKLRSNGPFHGTQPMDRQMLLLVLDELNSSYCGCGPSTGKPEGDRTS